LKSEFALVERQFVPFTPTQSHANSPELGIYKLSLEQLDHHTFVVVLLSMDSVPFSIPILEIDKDSLDKRNRLTVHLAMQWSQVIRYTD
jgi:hypothetical protein